MNPDTFNQWLASIPEGTEAFLNLLRIKPTPLFSLVIALTLIVVIAVITHLILHRGLKVLLRHLAQKSRNVWKAALFDGYLFQRVAFTVQAVLIQIQAELWLDPGTLPLVIISTATRLWIIVFSLLILYSVLDTLLALSRQHRSFQDLTCPINGRRLTNLGTFRVYLTRYLQNHSGINAGMTLMVRQLEPCSDGIPIQVYAFANTTVWTEYEEIQSDIFDHVLAVIPQFGLRLHQTPTGHDIRESVSELARVTDRPTQATGS